MTISFLKYCWTRLRTGSKAQTQYNHDAGQEWSETDMIEDELPDDAVNRSVLVVRPAEPFKRWAAKVDEEMFAKIRHTLTAEEREYMKPEQDQLTGDHTAYLIPLQDSLEVEPELLKAIYATIFERELTSCCTDKKQWPKQRTPALFRQWFDLELCGMVVDLCEGGSKRNE